MSLPVNKEYLEESLIDFDLKISEKKYLHNDDSTIHTHDNKSVLDKISESNEGNILFDGKNIGSGDISADLDAAFLEHNTSDTSHNDLRNILSNLSIRLNALADSDDETLDQLSEIVGYIKNNKSLIDGITTSKVSVSDILSDINLVKENTVSGKIVDSLVIKEILNLIVSHAHGDMKTITFSTTEPTTVAEGEIVMVYEV